MVSTRTSLLAACLTAVLAAQPRHSPNIPVLTVCELLRNLNHYRGKDVVLVGVAGWTFDGGFFDEPCEPGHRVFIQGHRWLSMVGWVSRGFSDQVPVDERTILDKLLQVRGYADIANHCPAPTVSSNRNSAEVCTWFLGDVVAVYGRIESPARLRPQRFPNNRNVPGNAFGANGTVPARILATASKTLVAGRGILVAPKPPTRSPPELPEPPAIPAPTGVPTPPWFLPS